jgi:hypothetical protein
MSTPDPRLAFLHRAAARLHLAQSCDLELGEAVAGLVPALEDILGRRLLCSCACDIIDRWERLAPQHKPSRKARAT